MSTPKIAGLPPQARAHLLAVLDLLYPLGAPQRGLQDAPDAAVAWQVQSALDDFADVAAIDAPRLERAA